MKHGAMRRVCASVVLIALAASAHAFVEIELIRPKERFAIGQIDSFVTNDPTLTIIGEARSDGGDLLISIETPGGVPALDRVETPLSRVMLDAGEPRSLAAVAFEPVIEETGAGARSYGPRQFAISFSNDGATFSSPIPLVSASGVASADLAAVVVLPEVATARFARLEWLSGWQRRTDGQPDVRLRSVTLISDAGELLPTRLRRVSRLIPSAEPIEPFALSVTLNAGSNRIGVSGEQLSNPERPLSRRADSAFIDATLVEQFSVADPDDENAEPTVLSDGSNVAVTIAPGVADETMRGLSVIRDDANAIPPFTYRGHRLIADEFAPIFSYRFEGRFQTAFEAEASSSLPGQPPSLAVDGRFDVPSTWVSALAPFPIRWRVHFGRIASVGRVVVHARRDGDTSFGPDKAQVNVSEDGENFVTVLDVEDFEDGTTEIELPTAAQAQWVELVIEAGKAANNIQINEIEFFDENGAAILAQTARTEVAFRDPVRLSARVFESDLIAANAPTDAPLGLFLWNSQASQWEWTGAARVSDGEGGGLFEIETNILAPLALFVAHPRSTSPVTFSASWNFNPFSPNGDGIADTTRLTVRADRFANSPSSALNNSAAFTVNLYDMRGMLVQTLADRATAPSGAMTIEWDGRDRNGRSVPIGPYIYEAQLHQAGASRPTSVVNGVIVVAR